MKIGLLPHLVALRAGTSLLRTERWQKAAFVLGLATRLGPDQWESHNRLAIALLKLGRWSEAAEALKRAISLSPGAPEPQTHLGVALLKMERWDKAAVAYSRAIELDPAQESSYEGLGIALLKLGRCEQAAAAYERGIDLNPRNAASLEGLGATLASLGRWEEATAAYQRCLQFHPHDASAMQGLRIALANLGRWHEAEALYQRAVKLHPDVATFYEEQGVALAKLRRWEEAAAVFQRAIELDAGSHSLHEKLAGTLSVLERWSEAAAAYQRAIELNPGSHSLYDELARSLSRLERWAEAAAAIQRASDLRGKPDPFRNLPAEYAARLHQQIAELDRGDPESYANFANLVAKLQSSDETLAAHQQAVALSPSDAATHLSVAIELLKLERWQEAVAALEEGASLAPAVTSFHFLRVAPLMKLGRAQEAVLVHSLAVGHGRILPSLPGESATTRFEQRRASFWTRENLPAEVFGTERWLEHLSSVPTATRPTLDDDAGEKPASAARLLFVLDNDYGELTTLMYLVLGQELLNHTTLLLPPRLYANNADAIPRRTHLYGSLEDVMQVVEREKPEIVFLCSGYLFSGHEIFSLETLERLVRSLRDKGCRVVTTDPFLGMLSKEDPSSLISIDIPASHPLASVDLMRERKQSSEDTMRAHFSQSERILRDLLHLYPAFCDVPEHAADMLDQRSISFFNAKLSGPKSDLSVNGPAIRHDSVKPHWLFTLSRADYDTQTLFEGSELRFADIVARKLVETVAAGRHPILVGPREFVEILVTRMPTTEGVDILPYCPFKQFMSLLLAAEHAFYWNVVSHSLLMRLFNKRPIVLFDRGHLVRNARIYDRVVQWYYQGWEPTFRDHHQRLTLETVSSWAEAYRKEADRIFERFRRAPTPDEMIANIVTAGAN